MPADFFLGWLHCDYWSCSILLWSDVYAQWRLQTILLSRVFTNKICCNYMQQFFKSFSYYDLELFYYCLNAKGFFWIWYSFKNDSFLLEVSQTNTVHFYECEILSISSLLFHFLLCVFAYKFRGNNSQKKVTELKKKTHRFQKSSPDMFYF